MLISMLATAWGYSSQQQEFLSAAAAPADDAMGPNMNFAPLSTTMKCTINLTIQYMVFYTPMACLLFVGFRMRVLQLTKGEGNPPEYVQMAMQCVAYSILANTLMVLLIPIFVKGADVELTKEGEMKMDGSNPFENQALAVVFTVIRYLCF